MLTNDQLLHLMTWLSPTFPVGSFSYSHGLEYAVEANLVNSGHSLCEWVEGILRFGSGQSDAVLLAESWHHATQQDYERLLSINAFANALRTTKEMMLESTLQGIAFVSMVNETAKLPTLLQFQSTLEHGNECISYPVAVAVASADLNIDLKSALAAYLHAFASNLISAGVRLIPLGQKAGLRALASINEAILPLVDIAVNRSIVDIGSTTPMVDWTSAMHETQYTRLFRS